MPLARICSLPQLLWQMWRRNSRYGCVVHQTVMGDAMIEHREPKRSRASIKDDVKEMKWRQGLACSTAVKGVVLCRAVQHGMDRITETPGVRIVYEVHREAAVGHHRLNRPIAVRRKILRCSIVLAETVLLTVSTMTLAQWSVDLDKPAEPVEVVRRGETAALRVLRRVIPLRLTAVPRLLVQQLIRLPVMRETAGPSGW